MASAPGRTGFSGAGAPDYGRNQGRVLAVAHESRRVRTGHADAVGDYRSLWGRFECGVTPSAA